MMNKPTCQAQTEIHATRTVFQKASRLLCEDSAATAVEYAILLALIAGVLMASAFAAGGVSSIVWGSNADSINVINN